MLLLIVDLAGYGRLLVLLFLSLPLLPQRLLFLRLVELEQEKQHAVVLPPF